MTDLAKFKNCLREIGVSFKEEIRHGYTFIVFCHRDDVDKPIIFTESFIEFDENGTLASY